MSFRNGDDDDDTTVTEREYVTKVHCLLEKTEKRKKERKKEKEKRKKNKRKRKKEREKRKRKKIGHKTPRASVLMMESSFTITWH